MPKITNQQRINLLFRDSNGYLHTWVVIVLIILGVILAVFILIAIITFFVMLASQWTCNAWARNNPHLEIKFFWDGLQGCMVRMDDAWISSGLVRELIK